jgi:hypothetical protein
VVRWVTKQLIVGIIRTKKTIYVALVFKNAMTNLEHIIVPTSDYPIILPTKLQLILLILISLLEPIVMSSIILKQPVLRNKQIFAINQITKQIQMKLLMSSLLQPLWNFGLATTQKLSDTIFIGFSGATCHMRYSSVGMFNLKPYQTISRMEQT